MMLGEYPLELTINHGDQNVASVTIQIPIRMGDSWLGEDGKQYVSVTPIVDEETIRLALLEALKED